MIVFARRWGCNERNNEHRWLWIPDQRSRCSLVRDDADGFNFQNSRGTCVGILAARTASEFLAFCHPRQWRVQGMPDARCTRGLVCKNVQRSAHEHTGSAEAIRHSLRNGFTAYAALSPAT